MHGVMVRELGLRRVMLMLLFAAWLSVQFLVVALSPSWGFVLPHEHITRGILTDAAWQDHVREHRGAFLNVSALRCNDARALESNAVVASIPNGVGAISSFALLTATLQDAHIEIPTPAASCVTFTPAQFFAFDVSYPPLDPPPNL